MKEESDVVKNPVRRKQVTRRASRRKRSSSLYLILVLLLAGGVGAALSMTVFFNITTVRVTGETEYSSSQVIEASGLMPGDNLVRLDPYVVEQEILSRLLTVEDVTVTKAFPDTVEIHVTKCVPYLNVQHGLEYMIVSRNGKILAENDTPQNGLLTFLGYDPTDATIGGTLTSGDEQKDSIQSDFCKIFSENAFTEITAVQMKNKYDIIVYYGDWIEFHIGDASDLVYKLTLAERAIADLNSEKQYQMTMIGDNQLSVIQLETEEPTETEPSDSESETDENGDPVETENSSETDTDRLESEA